MRMERAEQQAVFCIATGVQPSEYQRLSQTEVNAFIKAARQAGKLK